MSRIVPVASQAADAAEEAATLPHKVAEALLVATFFGLLVLAAVAAWQSMRIDCRDSAQFLTDGYGTPLTDELGGPFQVGRERQCRLIVAGDVWVPWPGWNAVP